MKFTHTHRTWLRLNNSVFYITLLALVILTAQLSIKKNIQYDLTQNNRNSLSEVSVKFLSQLAAPVTIKAFISPENPYKAELVTLLSRFQSTTDLITISYINPDFEPDKVRDMNIQQQPELVVSSGQNLKHVLDLSEQSLINAISTVLKNDATWLMFVEGHGERTPFNQANFNVSILGDHLKQKGYKLQGLNLVTAGQIPVNTGALIIASPERPWLEGEVKIVQDYINSGGNILWLNEPDNKSNLALLADQLGLKFTNGTIIDPNTELLGINDPTFTLVTDYADHSISRATQSVTLFPKATAIEQIDNSHWNFTRLLTTPANTWSDISPSLNPIYDSSEDTKGPLTLAVLLSSLDSDKVSQGALEQHIAVIGDGDFLSNTYIGNAANLDFAIALIDWLTQQDQSIVLPVKLTRDNQLELTRTQSLLIGLGFLLGVPLLLALIGFLIWLRRRKQ